MLVTKPATTTPEMDANGHGLQVDACMAQAVEGGDA